MRNITDLPLGIQLTIRYLSGTSLSALGAELGISKQAVHGKVQLGREQLLSLATPCQPPPSLCDFEKAQKEIKRLKWLVGHLQRQLALIGSQKRLLEFFKERVLRFFPLFKLSRFSAPQKLQLLHDLLKFQRLGGTIKDFASSIAISPQTLKRWRTLYKKYGTGGLQDRLSRPKHFGNKIPRWVKTQLILLFIKFPRWTPFQYHSYIRHNPTIGYYTSLPVIKKLKSVHQRKTVAEKQRIKKRWAFAPGTSVWCVDFTSVLKTPAFHLQLLTVSDHRSRFFIHSAVFLNTSTQIVVNELMELFIKFGKPLIIKADNGVEFKVDCKKSLEQLSVHLLNSPPYWAKFNASHERLHRTLKAFLSSFEKHKSLTRLVDEIRSFTEQYNYSMKFDYLDGKTPAEVFFDDDGFCPKEGEIITPYEKEGELRVKFSNRNGKPARLSIPSIQDDTTP